MIRRGDVTDIACCCFFAPAAVGNKVSHIKLTLHCVVNMALSYHSLVF